MSQNWPLVPLGDILTKSTESVTLNPAHVYQEVTVRLWGKGVLERRKATGAEIATAERKVVRRDQFIMSKIDARNGAFGLVPKSLDGAVVSSDFPTYNLDLERIEPSYLSWLSRTHDFGDICKGASEGTTNRVRLKEDRFLATEIGIPSISEQHRIVARIEELAAKIEDARGLRSQATEDASHLMAAEEFYIWPDASLKNGVPLQGVTTHLARGRQSRQGESNHFLIKTQHVQMGKYLPTHLTLATDAAVRVAPVATVQPGDVLIACSAAGCLGRVACYSEPEKLASTDTHVAIARANTSIVLPEYLFAYLKGSQGQIQLRSREKGDWTREKIGFRFTELNVADLYRVPVPVPPLSEQRHIVAYLDGLQAKVDALKKLQAETAAELDALLPSILDKAFKGEL